MSSSRQSANRNSAMRMVFRIEDKRGNGPYRGRSVGLDCRPSEHPLPFEEDIRITSEYICGFESIKKLLAWFNDDDRSLLHRNEMMLVVYQTSDIMYGKRQIVFNQLTARKKMTFSIAK